MKKKTPLVLSVCLLLAIAVVSSTPTDKLQHEVEQLRGLRFLKPLTVKTLSAADMKSELRRQMAREYPSDEWPKEEATLKAFFLIPPKMRLRAVLTALMEEQTAGLYDPRSKVLFVAKDPIQSEELQAMGLGLEMESIFLSHEMDHALTDQHFDLLSLPIEDRKNEDRADAARCVVEGDATWVMMRYVLKAMNIPEEKASGLDNLASTMGLGNELTGSAAPAYIMKNLLIGYLGGYRLVSEAYKRGGFKAVNALYRNPPASMEQVLHTSKYFNRSDPPLKVYCPVSKEWRKGGWKTLSEGTWGEFNISIMLEEWGVAKAEAERAAAGWGGDAFRVLRSEGKPDGFIWVTAWDTLRDAKEFAAAALKNRKLKVTLKANVVTVEKKATTKTAAG